MLEYKFGTFRNVKYVPACDIRPSKETRKDIKQHRKEGTFCDNKYHVVSSMKSSCIYGTLYRNNDACLCYEILYYFQIYKFLTEG